MTPSYQYPHTVLAVFCKAPVPGQVKTRLMTALTAQQAADAHVELAQHTLQWTTASRLCPVQLWCAPSLDHAFFAAAAAQYAVPLMRQQGDDLGERMYFALRTALTRYQYALIVGCDCPSLCADDLQQAQAALQRGVELVLAPAEDGGYVLIGANQAYRPLFAGMRWGTAGVYAETVARAAALGLSCHRLALQWDVDTPEDWVRYQALR